MRALLRRQKQGLFTVAFIISVLASSTGVWGQGQNQHTATPPQMTEDPSRQMAQSSTSKTANEPPATQLFRPTEPTPLEDLMLEKGIITMDDWLRIKAEEERKGLQERAEIQMGGSPRWYERIKISGYVQVRYALNGNPMMDIPLGDKNATAKPQSFYFRRIRMPIQGQISERLAFYLQPAFEGDGYNTGNSVDLVDAFGDFYITTNKQNRLRFGLQRVPNSFDTYRSSSQRQELDRAEAIQSGTPGERDLGISYMWTSKIAQDRFAQLATYHNGPGDYGNFAIMVYNGQTRNKVEANADKHVGIRLAHPFELPNGRLVEIGAQAYRGMYVVSTGGISQCPFAPHQYGSNNANTGCQIRDERLTGYLWTPTQPWGFLGEYTVGRGPKRNEQGVLEETHLYGFYVQPYYTYRYSDVGMLTGYFRYGEYRGGLKTVNGVDGKSNTVNVGLVWEPDTHWRYVIEYMYKDGLNSFQTSPGVPLTDTAPQSAFNGNLLRFQAQWFFN